MDGLKRVSMLAIAATIICFEVHAQELVPLEAYGGLPENSLVELSPDGTMAGMRITTDDKDTVVAVDIASRTLVEGTNADDVKPRYIMFPNSENMVIVAGNTVNSRFVSYSYEKSEAYGLDLRSGKIGSLLKGAPELHPRQRSLGRIVGLAPDGKTLFMPAFHRKINVANPKYGLYAVNPDRSRATRIKRGTPTTIDWFMDLMGNPLIREDYSQATNLHQIWRIGSGEEENTLLYEDESEIRDINLVGLGLDGKSMVVLATPSDSDVLKYYLMSLEDGEVSGPILERDGKDIEGVITDANRVVHGVEYAGFTPTYQFLDETLNSRVAAIQQRLPGMSARLTSWSSGFEKLLFHIEGGWSSGHYFIFEGDDQTPTPIGRDYPQISSKDLAPSIITEYEASDGLTIPAILTGTEEIKTAGSAPLIVMPHGGPESHDRIGFDWMAQYFASRGYLVLQPQFRGSSGFGFAHSEAGKGEWGGKMQSDLDDGVRYLVNEGLVDADRVCIVGSSYGGYAALAAGAFSAEMYSCVVSIAGVSDLYEMLVTERSEYGKNHWVVQYWSEQYGATMKDKDFIRSISPINSVDKFVAPVLLLHGKHDTVVRVTQSRRMHRALKQADKDVTFVQLEGEDHWLSGAETRLELLRVMADFIDEHL